MAATFPGQVKLRRVYVLLKLFEILRALNLVYNCSLPTNEINLTPSPTPICLPWNLDVMAETFPGQVKLRRVHVLPKLFEILRALNLVYNCSLPTNGISLTPSPTPICLPWNLDVMAATFPGQVKLSRVYVLPKLFEILRALNLVYNCSLPTNGISLTPSPTPICLPWNLDDLAATFLGQVKLRRVYVLLKLFEILRALNLVYNCSLPTNEISLTPSPTPICLPWNLDVMAETFPGQVKLKRVYVLSKLLEILRTLSLIHHCSLPTYVIRSTPSPTPTRLPQNLKDTTSTFSDNNALNKSDQLEGHGIPVSVSSGICFHNHSIYHRSTVRRKLAGTS
ncbi:uncharacterized protein LOC131682050 isoform X2 [Topomyia yanbarensis]|uniref:uncharacterized protein LOC131682050 isoform X2 n=1 Tax=Topomyia yanbarensis TaxID=2498891 RepID=UPI00273BCA3B|nr:uncharacterized protein LOC131682050 isoform X2 [Topomyia yanbarensis]